MISVVKPFPPNAVPRIWRWMSDVPCRVCDDFAPCTLEEFLAQWEQRRGVDTWGVLRNGELGGYVSFEKLTPVVGTVHVLFKRSFWGRGTTIPALELVYAQAFEQSGVSKILSLVFRDNHAIRALARHVGAREEGIFRNHTMRNGKPVDMVAIGLLKGEFLSWLNSQRTHCPPCSPAEAPSPGVSTAEAEPA
jgi:RimJ/RimL family protein N-acetyltransferase